MGKKLVVKREPLADNKIKTRLNNYCPNISLEMIFMNTKKQKNE